MRFKATHDPLTGLWNRGMILDLLQREIMRARRSEDGGMTIALGDVDHFKKVNDTYGHATGDAVLRAVASRLAKSVRSYDAVSRYGGEEFLVMLSGCRTAMGARRAENIRYAVQDEPMETPSGPVSVSISLGIAGTQDWRQLGAEQLINEADLALYRAKRLRRNRCVLAKPSGLEEIRRGHRAEASVTAE